jgi:hypothetical protein
VDRISFALAVRLFEMRSSLREQALVIDELDVLEGLRPRLHTKAAEQFKHVPLHPLWHKHFSAPRHAMRNIGNRWNICGTNQKALDAMVRKVAADYGADPDVWQRVLPHRFMLDGYTDRATNQRLTGDWIIFGKHDGANYYLDLATHEEARSPSVSSRSCVLAAPPSFRSYSTEHRRRRVMMRSSPAGIAQKATRPTSGHSTSAFMSTRPN